MKYWTIYLVGINIAGMVSMSLDKNRAIRHRRRISEKSLFLLALLGGSAGTFAGMHLFHHKTKHWYFRYGIPLILFLQLVVIGFIL